MLSLNKKLFWLFATITCSKLLVLKRKTIPCPICHHLACESFSLIVMGCEWVLGLTSVQALQNFVDVRKHSCAAGQPSLTPGTANTAKSVGTRRFPACHTQGLTLPWKDSCNKWSNFPSQVYAFCFNFFFVSSILYFHIYPEAHFKSPLEKWHTYFISHSVILCHATQKLQYFIATVFLWMHLPSLLVGKGKKSEESWQV